MAKRKIKLVIDGRVEYRDFTPHAVGLDDEGLAEAMDGAGWSDDPGTGGAVILPDGRELLNPVPLAIPVSILADKEPSVNDLVERALARHYEQLKAGDEVDSVEEADDFGGDDDFTPFSQYEILLSDEAPALKPVVVDDVVKADLAKVEADATAVVPVAPVAPKA